MNIHRKNEIKWYFWLRPKLLSLSLSACVASGHNLLLRLKLRAGDWCDPSLPCLIFSAAIYKAQAWQEYNHHPYQKRKPECKQNNRPIQKNFCFKQKRSWPESKPNDVSDSAGGFFLAGSTATSLANHYLNAFAPNKESKLNSEEYFIIWWLRHCNYFEFCGREWRIWCVPWYIRNYSLTLSEW